MKFKKLSELEDKYIGKKGTPKRDQYEQQLKMDIMGEKLRQLRKAQQLTQAELGERIGVQKAQISKLENGAGNATLSTLLRVFEALDAKVYFRVEWEGEHFDLA